MSRYPWRSRMWLAGLFNALVGAVAGVFIYLGATDELHVVEASLVPAVAILLDLAVTLGVLRDGENETTPVADPLGMDGLPLMPYRKLEDLREAVTTGDVVEAKRLLGVGDES